MKDFAVSGNVVDLHAGRVFGGTVEVRGGRIAGIREEGRTYATYLMPGFVDAHVHIESSMLVPSEFARLAVAHGTVGTVSDPHEIGNVLGVAGVDYMLEVARSVPLKVCFGAPSCVPATRFETAGAEIGAEEVERLLGRAEIGYLSEVMDFPGVIAGAAGVMAKIAAAHRAGKPVDGHAPGLGGEELRKYLGAGISTDHECFTIEEAEDKLGLGCRILIREGSAARNFDALYPLLSRYPGQVMLCTDDMHPDTLERGHIDRLAARAIRLGQPPMEVLRAACVNAVKHYRMPVGLLRVGDAADFIEVSDLRDLHVRRTWIDGELVAEDGRSLLNPPAARGVNRFLARPRRAEEFEARLPASARVHVIEAIDGQLITRHLRLRSSEVVGNGKILRLAVINRYAAEAAPALGFIRGFGMMRGAIASSVAHDSHNVVAVGSSAAEVCRAANLVIEAGGGLAAVEGRREELLPLPVAGIMSNADGHEVARAYSRIDQRAREMGSELAAPFMTLSFMSLLVIPALKLSDRGLFDSAHFRPLPMIDSDA